MSNAALTSEALQHPTRPILSLAVRNDDVAPLSRRIVVLGAILVTLQILDGFLTATGVNTFGLHAEGNPLLRHCMEIFGAVPAIVMTKCACIVLIVSLCFQAARVRWVSFALHGVAGLYTLCAIIPWSLILFSEYVVYIG